MKVIKVIAIIIALLAALGGSVIGSLYLVKNNPLDNSHKHELTKVEASDPTCDKAGYRAHYTCSGCDDVFADENGFVVLKQEEIEIAPYGHKLSEANCTVAQVCEICGNTVGDPKGHTPREAVKENVVSATCKAEGSYESVTYCAVCNAEMKREPVTTPISGHNPKAPVSENIVSATCKAEGSYDSVTYCSVCNIEISREEKVLPKGAHSPSEPVKENIVESTCIATGTYDSVVYCSVCDAEVSRTPMVSEKSNHVDKETVDGKCDVCGADVCLTHTEVIDAAVAATCTTDGLTEGSHCSVCGFVIKAQEVVKGGHKVVFDVSGALALKDDGSYDASGIVVSRFCTACEDYAVEVIPPQSEGVDGYVISANNAYENGGVIVYGDNRFEFPAVDFTLYDVASTYDGNDKTPVVVTAYTLKGTDFALTVTSDDCIDLSGDDTTKVVYSRYELYKLNNENVTVTYDEENGYTYASKQQHTIPYLVSYGTSLTVTGDVHVLAASRLNVNTHLIVGTDSVPANLKVERIEETSANNEVIALWQSGCLTVKNGTLTTVCKATKNYGVDIRVGATSSTNATSSSIILIEEKGAIVTEGVGEYSVFFNQKSDGRLIVDGSFTSDRNLVIASNFAQGDEYEYGFLPSLYIRKGTVTINGATKPACISSIQVGSEAENASGKLTIKTDNVDVFRMATAVIHMTFAKGELDLASSGNDKTIFQTGGDGTEGATAYRPYYSDPAKSVSGIIDFKKDIVVTASAGAGSKNNYFIGSWRPNAPFVQSWMVEEGAQFNFTDLDLFVRNPSGNNNKIIAYKEASINIDGSVKTAYVAAQLVSVVTTANTPSDLTYATLDASAVWTTDTATAAVQGFSLAKDANGNTIYYQIVE
ncbi:MAG: hypothetical protein J6K85_01505 [Clostridia bacterium]|nr:hypothetical protein [Clostridia bacterium]